MRQPSMPVSKVPLTTNSGPVGTVSASLSGEPATISPPKSPIRTSVAMRAAGSSTTDSRGHLGLCDGWVRPQAVAAIRMACAAGSLS